MPTSLLGPSFNTAVTVNVKLEVGASEQRIEVTAEGSPLNQVDATIKQVISPTSIEQLPLAVSGRGRRGHGAINGSLGATSFYSVRYAIADPSLNQKDGARPPVDPRPMS
jgi:hypothetical protein